MRELSPEEKKIVESLPPVREKPPAASTENMERIQKARELGIAGSGMDDPLNQMMRFGFFKDLRKDFKKGDEDRMSMRDMIEYAFAMRLLPPQDNQAGGSSAVQEMRTEFEKQRQFYEGKLKDQEEKIRDMVFEKKIQTLEERQTDTMANLSGQLEDLSQSVELIRSIPANVTPEQKKDAIEQLVDAGNQLESLKGTLAKFGLIPATPGAQTSAPSQQGKEVWRNPDGSTNKVMYLVDRITGAIEKGFDAWQKKTPDKGEFVETPAPARQEPQYTERRMSEEEYAEFLLSKPGLTPEQQQWLTNYRNYLIRQQAPPQTRVQEYKPPEPERREASQPAVQLARCRVCGRPEIYQGDLCEQCWKDQNRAPAQPEPEQPKKGIIDRLKEQEDDELRRTQGLV